MPILRSRRALVCGYGHTPKIGPGRLCVIEGSRGVRGEDVILIHPNSWMLVLGDCEDVSVSNLKEIGEVISSDGVDVCGCRRMRIEGCCLRNNDDGIAIKSLSYTERPDDGRLPWDRDVEDVTCWNIRVEHHYDKLLDFRVIRSRYSWDTERGTIQDVLLEDVHSHYSPINEGETKSLITGWSAESAAERITLRVIRFNGEKVATADRLNLFTRHARDVRIE